MSKRRDRFVESCNRRVNKLLKEIEALKTFKSKNMYVAEESELLQITSVLRDKIEELENYYLDKGDFDEWSLK